MRANFKMMCLCSTRAGDKIIYPISNVYKDMTIHKICCKVQ